MEADREGIVFLLPLNELAGAERSTLRVVKDLFLRGHRVRLITYGRKPRLAEGTIPAEHIFTLPAAHTTGALRPLMRLLGSLSPQLVISATRHANALAVLASAFASPGTPVVCIEHSAMAAGFSCLHSWKHSLMLRLLPHFYRRAACIVAVSEAQAGELRRLLKGAAPVMRIYNPIVGQEALPRQYPPPHTWLADRSTPVIMAVGRLSPEKGMHVLIRAFSAIRKFRHARLIVLGEGSERKKLEDLVRKLGLEDVVCMPGYQDNAQAWLAHATVFASPSFYEGFGNAIVEAMALGVPVVATDCPIGPREILEGGRYGKMVPPDDPVALAHALLEVLEQELPPDISAAQARARQFSVHACVQQYEHLIHAVQGSHAAISFGQKLAERLKRAVLQEHWMIGVIDEPQPGCITWNACPPVHWIKRRGRGSYLADPFHLPGDENILLCEKLNTNSDLGDIVRIELGENNNIIGETKVEFDDDCHLSFPYIFTHEGKHYCLPESSAAGCLRIYQQESYGWKLHSTPLPETPAADSVLFTHNGLFWIAYTDLTLGAHNNLNLIYAPTLNGPWQTHPMNPVRISKRNARNGGTPFTSGGKLYRIAQDCTLTYGGALCIMEVTTCTPQRYEEHEVNHIAPATGSRNAAGLHTLNPYGTRCLVDGKRWRFSLSKLIRKLSRKIYQMTRHK